MTFQRGRGMRSEEFRRHRKAQQALGQCLTKAADQLLAELGEPQGPLAVSLLDELHSHTPIAFLQAWSAGKLVALVKEFFRFLEVAQEPVRVAILPATEGRAALLLSNTLDAPYLVDGIQLELRRQNQPFQVVSHPILAVTRDAGRLLGLGGLKCAGVRESLVVIELEDFAPEGQELLLAGVRHSLQQTLTVDQDGPRLLQALQACAGSKEVEGRRDFWQWLQQGNFLLFSWQQLEVRATAGGVELRQTPQGRCGLSPELNQAREDAWTALQQPVAALQRLLRKEPLVVEPLERPSPIHRSDPLVYLGVREELAPGLWREQAFLGLFTTQAVDELSFNVPPLRRRIEMALEILAIPVNCHDWRKTIEILNTFPKVELFFMSPEDLLETVRSFTVLYRHGAVKVVATRTPAVRGLTLLVIMPRRFYNEEAMARAEQYLCRVFESPSAATQIIHVSEAYLSLHVALHPQQDELPFDLDRIESNLTRICRPWDLRLQQLLEQRLGDGQSARLWQRYQQAFSREYRHLLHPRFALRDLLALEQLLAGGKEQFDLWGPFAGNEPFYRLQFYSDKTSYLNELMPFLENLNLCVIEEVDFTLRIAGKKLFIKSFAVRECTGGPTLSSLRRQLLEALEALRQGACGNDYLNRLLVLTGLSWQQLDIFRGYRNYHFQLGSSYSMRSVAFALINHPAVALLLYRYFEGRFLDHPRWADPLLREEEVLSPIRQQLAQALEQVEDVNEDAILRLLFNLIDSTVRTNFFLRCGSEDYFFAFKISALGIIDMPAPRPLFEIYVHSATMEGIHLRGGKVARGGIRWSNRPDDFRTEILGLMKTQMTKNALIVPVGSKGGFIVKTSWSTREEGAALSKAAYQTLMRGLLDLTDNRIGERVEHPQGVVCYDDFDPYLVVAADKGTAHLPDTANAVSQEYGFWLGDAFASGGSRGYDHKALGITARGAWECVKRHFREMGRNIQQQPFTVVGVGDMSGDVFGNGMLLSRQIRLLAAFDHRHIFLDPDPDPERSWVERQRLFNLPRSSWADYDPQLISAGGGVFPRDAKEIPLSAAVREWLGVRHASLDGQGLIRLLLGAPVDLFWNGGIGTYFKASSEKHEDAGDRANDGVRLDATQLRAKVVGEGGNLGMTQRARIEYALAGGRLNTDAVDNSAGVDCSDHEVNLKILMQVLMSTGQVQSLEQRDELLSSMTDEVCEAVLENNYGQSLCLSLDQLRAGNEVEPYLELTDRLSSAGLLDRRGECLPSGKDVRARETATLARPELAILMAYSKMQLYQALLAGNLPQSEGIQELYRSYFPARARQLFGDRLAGHPLAREIAATVVTNRVINQAGSPLLSQLATKTGTSVTQVCATYLTLDQVFSGAELRRQLYRLDDRCSADLQAALLLRLENLLASQVAWALEQELGLEPGIETVQSLRNQAEALVANLGEVLDAGANAKLRQEQLRLRQLGLPEQPARMLAQLTVMDHFLAVVTLAQASGRELPLVAKSHNEVRHYFGVDETLDAMGAVPLRDRWDRQALHALQGGLNATCYKLALAVWQQADGQLGGYLAARRSKVKFYLALRDAARREVSGNFHPFLALARGLDGLLG